MSSTIKTICVFCGSSPGRISAYEDAARNLGSDIARRGIGLVYGGAKVGLMGTVADAALDHGGHVTGVITHALADLVAHPRLALERVATMH